MGRERQNALYCGNIYGSSTALGNEPLLDGLEEEEEEEKCDGSCFFPSFLHCQRFREEGFGTSPFTKKRNLFSHSNMQVVSVWKKRDQSEQLQWNSVNCIFFGSTQPTRVQSTMEAQ